MPVHSRKPPTLLFVEIQRAFVDYFTTITEKKVQCRISARGGSITTFSRARSGLGSCSGFQYLFPLSFILAIQAIPLFF